MARQLPKLYPAFVRMLVDIAENGNQYRGSDTTPLARTDKEKLGLVIYDVQKWCEDNKDLIQMLGMNYRLRKEIKTFLPFKTACK